MQALEPQLPNQPPTRYLAGDHPIIRCDTKCTICPLGKVREARNKKATEANMANDGSRRTEPLSLVAPGAGPDDVNDVKLIVISDFSGHWEAANGEPFWDTRRGENGDRLKSGLLRPYNAGGYIRYKLNQIYGLNTYDDCWVTNVLKCDPGARKPLLHTHVKPCVLSWLKLELETLPSTVPMLVCGSLAFRGLRLLYPKVLDGMGLNDCRRRSDLKLGRHPTVFTLNPARPARCEPRIESTTKYKKGNNVVTSNQWLTPYLPGSPSWSFHQDLLMLKPYL
jgi:hypothetical protein